nr:NAC domain-containing protein 100-like [Ipomoea batatas]
MEKHSPKPQTKLSKKHTSQYPEEEVILKCNNSSKESRVDASQNPEKRAVLVPRFRGNRKRSNASPIHEEHIAEIDMNRFEPRDLPGTAKMGGKERYYFCLRDRTQPPELRTTGAGHWKATGKSSKKICRVKGNLVGLKTTLVYQSSAGNEEKNCVMHEYRLEGIKNSMPHLPENAKNEWVICKVFWKSSGTLVESINKDDIKKCFGKYLDDAAKECGVSRSTFKRACRRHGIQGWESKKRKKVNQQGNEHPVIQDDHQSSNLGIGNGIMASSSLWVKAEHDNDVVMFVLPNATVDGLKREILKRFKLEPETLKIRYKDGDEEMVSVACDEDLLYCLEFFKTTEKAAVRFSVYKDQN